METFNKNEVIYSLELKPNCSYVILWGKVSVVDDKTKASAVYEQGETLHEEHLLEFRRYEMSFIN